MIRKYHSQMSVTVSIDGVQELHDRFRVDENGKGSFSAAFRAFQDGKQYGWYHSKMTFVPGSFKYIFDSVKMMAADEGQNNSFGVLVDKVTVSVWMLEHVKNQVANILCGVEAHVLLSLVMLIAVRAAEVAAAGYLKGDLSAGRHILRIAPAVKALDHVPIVLKAFTRKH